MIINDDCLNALKNIEDSSVDLVLTDPPYGTITNTPTGWNRDTSWDVVLDQKKVWSELNRVCRPGANIILFSQEPFTSSLIKDNRNSNIDFCSRSIWLKNSAGNMLGVNKNVVNFFEDICLFRKKIVLYDTDKDNPLRDYAKEIFEHINKTHKEIIKELNNTTVGHFIGYDNIQFSIPKFEIYQKMIDLYHIDKLNSFIEYDELKRIHLESKTKTREKYNSRTVFNLWQGNKYKSNVYEYKKDSVKYHPTQKPILLLEDLIKTYSNPDELVLDYTMGSGSTGVACLNTGRRFIGIEKDEGYFNIAKERLNK